MKRGPKPLSARSLKLLDVSASRRFGIPALILMENAGIACKEEVLKRYPNAKRFMVICGRGNNGGDGFVLARQLLNSGKSVQVFCFGAPSDNSPDAQLNFNILQKLRMPCFDLLGRAGYRRFLAALKLSDIVVDAIFGIGLKRNIGEPHCSVIRSVNLSGKTVVSIDVPSGIHADSGRVLGEAIKADLCVTFVRPKLGFQKAKKYTGRVVVRDISVPN